MGRVQAVLTGLAVMVSLCSGALAQTSGFPLERYDAAIASYQRDLAKAAKTLGKPVPQLQRELAATARAGNARNTAAAIEPLLGLSGGDAALWRRLAEALATAEPVNDQDASELPGKALAAALKTLNLSRTPSDRAEALALAGAALARQESWRPALQAYKASLALADDGAVRRTFEDLREQHGFRVTDYSVDSDAVEPRVCLQFSEALGAGVADFTPYFTQEPGPVSAVTLNGDRLCVEGLKHGASYTVTVRQGLPSAVDETLPKDFAYQVYVRDRTPAVRFVGKSYVLPTIGQNGLPILSVNSHQARLTVYRIGDRSLTAAVIDSNFLQQLYSYGAEELGRSKGQKVWQGTLDTEAPQNQDVTTAIPVDEALGRLEPGLYAMTAAPAEQPAAEGQLATQWFVVSDLGLATLMGKDGLHVGVRSLASAEPLRDVEVRLLARNNEVLGIVRTDAEGQAAFEPGLTRGQEGLQPALVVASRNTGSQPQDYGFLDLTGSAFDLTDRGVAGREPPGPVDAFVYAERGVYRRGETAHAAVLLRDDGAKALAGVPVTVTVERPDGVEYSRATPPDVGAGARVLDIPLAAGAPGGTWQIRAYTDPKRPPVGQASFLVEDYVPNRIEFDLKAAAEQISAGGTAAVALDGRYLFGAPAAGLDIEGDVSVAADEAPFPAWPGYRFGLGDETVQPVQNALAGLPQTDAKGHADLLAALPELPTTTKPLAAHLVIRLREPGGRAVEKALDLKVAGDRPLLGLKSDFGSSGVRNGEAARLLAIALDPQGRRIAVPGAHWSLKRLTTTYQWFQTNGSWSFEPVTRSSKLADGTLEIAAETPGALSRPLDWGEYRMEVQAEGFKPASLDFSVGFYSSSKADTPDMLGVALDRTSVKAGETVNLKIDAGFAGKATVQVIGDRLLASRLVDVPAGGFTVPIAVREGWGTGAYAVVSMVRPLDAAAKRMPSRAIGLAWFGIDRAERTLAVSLQPVPSMKPRGPLAVPVSIAGLAPGSEAYVTVAAVDVGILDLTGYKAPAPESYYYDQRRLSAEMRDLYGQLIDGMGGVRGRIRSGGDSGAGQLQAPPPTQPPLAQFSGVVKVGPNGKAEVRFDIPAFNGTVRLMVVAWTADRVGHAQADVVVRDPVVIAGTLPRFLAMGDRSRLRLDLVNAEAPPGDYTLAVDVEGPVEAEAASTYQSVHIGAVGSRTPVTVPITATGIGTARLTATLGGPGQVAIDQSYALGVEPANPEVTRRSPQAIGPGGAVTISSDLLAEMVPGTGTVSLSMGPLPELDVPALLRELDRYPYGCSEQLVSRALPLLYLSDLGGSDVGLDAHVHQRLADTVQRLGVRQASSGAFGLWDSDGAEDLWLTSFVTDFLLRAREKGFAVPEGVLTQAVDYLRNRVGNAPEIEKGRGEDIAYALYTLARAGRAPAGDLKYFADTKIEDFGSALAQAQVGAALGLIGDRTRAGEAFVSAAETLHAAAENRERSSRSDYGSVLRDAAAVVALAGDATPPPTVIRTASAVIAEERKSSPVVSTQEATWMVLAARALADEAKALQLNVDGQAHTGAFYRVFRTLDQPVTVANAGPQPLRAMVAVQGSPVIPEPAASNGMTLTRTYYAQDGKPVDPTRVAQNTRLVVVLTAEETSPAKATGDDASTDGDAEKIQATGHFLLVDRLPAGFEIENPDLVGSGDTSGLPWLQDVTQATHAEFRDDRFVAAFDGGPAKLAYMVRAVAPGRYGHPGATVEDMYRPVVNARTASGTVTVADR